MDARVKFLMPFHPENLNGSAKNTALSALRSSTADRWKECNAIVCLQTMGAIMDEATIHDAEMDFVLRNGELSNEVCNRRLFIECGIKGHGGSAGRRVDSECGK